MAAKSADGIALARSPVEPDSLFFSLQMIKEFWEMIRIFELDKEIVCVACGAKIKHV